MKYAEAMKEINTKRALEYLGLKYTEDGSYLKFQCLCGGLASIRTHGEKKNLYYCEACKVGGNLLWLAAKMKEMDYLDVKKELLEKATLTDKPIEEELNLNYELEFTEQMAKMELSKELCERMGVGRPKGKTMLSGTIAFTVHNERGVKVAYYGIKPDGTKKFHSSFNPELYLFGYHLVDPQVEVWVAQSLFSSLRLMQEGKQAVSNFNLPYLSKKHYELLSNCDRVVFDWTGDKRSIAYSNIGQLKTFYRFA